MKHILYIFILAFLLSIASINALNSDNLVSYLTFNNNTNDLLNNKVITPSGSFSYTDGKYSTAVYFGTGSSTKLNTTYPMNDSWSINLWFKYSGLTNTQNIIYFKNSTHYYSLSPRTFGGTHIYYNNIIGQASLNLSPVNNPSINTYHMLTLTYDTSTDTISYYLDKILMKTDSINNIPSSTNILYLGNECPYCEYDELSIWNTVLSAEDIITLYSNGDGMDYNDTIMNVTSETPSTITIDGNIFSKKQCFYAEGSSYLCNNSIYWNSTNAFLCAEEDIINCTSGCMQSILDTDTGELGFYHSEKSCSILRQEYIPLGYKLLCSVFWLDGLYQPDSLGFENAIIYYNMCLATGSATIDTSFCQPSTDLWTIINDSHTYYTEGQCFNGTPVSSTDLCSIENQTVCLDDYHVQKCVRDYTGYLSWNTTEDCEDSGSRYRCTAGRCQELSYECHFDSECADGYFCNSNGQNPDYKCYLSSSDTNPLHDGSLFDGVSWELRNLISAIIIIVFTLIMVIVAISANIEGRVMGVIILIIDIILVFGLIYAKGLYWWIALIIGILSAGLLSMWVKHSFSAGDA